MKFIHTADWHLGKIVHQKSMIEDQAHVLKQLTEFLKENKIEVLVIAGDVYDRSIPSTEAVNLLNDFLDEVINELNVKVLMISGNHDSAERLNFASPLLEKNGLYIESLTGETIKKIILQDEFGPVNFYLNPFFKPSEIRFLFKQPDLKEFNEAMSYYLSVNPINPKERNVLVTHQFISGMAKDIESDSELPLVIGGTAEIKAENVGAFDYVALGHLHAPQAISDKKIRYSGSLLKYSETESYQRKGFNVVELGEKGNLEIKEVPLVPKRDFRVVKGLFEDLLNTPKGNIDDYIVFRLEDDSVAIDGMDRLRRVYPNVMKIQYTKDAKTSFDTTTKARSTDLLKNELAMFTDFFRDMTKEELTPEQIDIMTDVIETARKKFYEAD
jgi:DNA repair protein SbcD/Mre11